jgi:hypothetical protein
MDNTVISRAMAGPTAKVADPALRLLLCYLGHGLAVGSRWVPSIRSQVTRTLTFQMSAGDTVARHWSFDGQRRHIHTAPGRAAHADTAVHFASSAQALRHLASPRAVDRIVADLQCGRIDLQGSALILLWFYGLTRKLIKIGREKGPRTPVPGAYLAHDPAANGVETILIEPCVTELDHDWPDAWNARAKLWIVRGANGEPMPDP